MSMTTATTVVPSPHPQAYGSPRWSPEQPILLDSASNVRVLRRRASVPVGGLGLGTVIHGRRLVRARDLDDAPWWVPARTVWSDAEEREHPEHPSFVGLATDRSWTRAVLTGLSDRLGWEARQVFEAGGTLARLDGVGPLGPSTVYDGRLGHEVPCVLVVSEQAVRWGAGVTTETAYRRALFGDQSRSEDDAARELADLRLLLNDVDLEVVVVDLGTALLRRAGVARVSVQLVGR